MFGESDIVNQLSIHFTSASMWENILKTVVVIVAEELVREMISSVDKETQKRKCA